MPVSTKSVSVNVLEKRSDRALILVSHQADAVKTHCKRAAVLVDGMRAV